MHDSGSDIAFEGPNRSRRDSTPDPAPGRLPPGVAGDPAGDHEHGNAGGSGVVDHPAHHLSHEGLRVEGSLTADHQIGAGQVPTEPHGTGNQLVTGAQLTAEGHDGPAESPGRPGTGHRRHVHTELVAVATGECLQPLLERADLFGRGSLLRREEPGGIDESDAHVAGADQLGPSQPTGLPHEGTCLPPAVGRGRSSEADEDSDHPPPRWSPPWR